MRAAASVDDLDAWTVPGMDSAGTVGTVLGCPGAALAGPGDAATSSVPGGVTVPIRAVPACPDWCDQDRCDVGVLDGWHQSTPIAVVRPEAGELEDAVAEVVLTQYAARSTGGSGGPGPWSSGEVVPAVSFEAPDGHGGWAPTASLWTSPRAARELAAGLTEAARRADELNATGPGRTI